MSNGLILAIDQGTTNTKALAFDADGKVVASASVPMAVSYPQPGWAQQSATDIWDSVSAVIAKVVAETGTDMDALAISNQRETIVVWDAATGQPIAPAITWQCRRSGPKCAAIRAAGHADEIEARTGLGLDPLFPAAKIAWILDNVPGARDAANSGALRAGTVDAWLLWNLTGGEHATDHSNASRTQLFNIRTLQWDPDLATIFDVPLSLLPRVRNSDSLFGEVAAGRTALATGTPVHAMVGDSHAALFGHGVRQPGTVKATYGTGTSLMTLTADRIASHNGLSSTIAWSTSAGVAYAIEGNISVSGQAVAFMGSLLGIGDPAAVADLAATVPDSNGVYFVPALVGLGAPHWAPDARGIVSGLSLGTRPAHLARAAVEAIAFQVADVFTAMETDLGTPLARLSADGGAARNDMLMQLQADLIGRPVVRGDLPEVSAAGAAMLAASGLGRASTRSTRQIEFAPAISAEDRAGRLAGWRQAIHRVLQSDHHTSN
jgi:glycerol kinase